MSTGIFFWAFKSQTIYFMVIFCLMCMAISWVALFAPESPMFLYEKGRFEDLAGCLTKIASVNGTFDA